PGRMLVPMSEKSHFRMFRTPVPPPDDTPGAEPAALDITGKFVDPDFYFGGPGNAPAAAIAPDQSDVLTRTIHISSAGGAGTGGTSTLKHNGHETGTITNAGTAANVKTALVALDDGFTAADWATSGGALPGTDVVVTMPGGTLEVGTNSLTG